MYLFLLDPKATTTAPAEIPTDQTTVSAGAATQAKPAAAVPTFATTAISVASAANSLFPAKDSYSGGSF